MYIPELVANTPFLDQDSNYIIGEKMVQLVKLNKITGSTVQGQYSINPFLKSLEFNYSNEANLTKNQMWLVLHEYKLRSVNIISSKIIIDQELWMTSYTKITDPFSTSQEYEMPLTFLGLDCIVRRNLLHVRSLRSGKFYEWSFKTDFPIAVVFQWINGELKEIPVNKHLILDNEKLEIYTQNSIMFSLYSYKNQDLDFYQKGLKKVWKYQPENYSELPISEIKLAYPLINIHSNLSLHDSPNISNHGKSGEKAKESVYTYYATYLLLIIIIILLLVNLSFSILFKKPQEKINKKKIDNSSSKKKNAKGKKDKTHKHDKGDKFKKSPKNQKIDKEIKDEQTEKPIKNQKLDNASQKKSDISIEEENLKEENNTEINELKSENINANNKLMKVLIKIDWINNV